jgi:hypothetical protein
MRETDRGECSIGGNYQDSYALARNLFVFASLHPMGRMGEISEIVDAILYLESANS